MFHFSERLILLVIIFSCLFFYLVSCGGNNTAVPVVQTPVNEEFNQFVEVNRLKSPVEFVEWWNTTERYNGWTFSYYGQNGLIWPDKSTVEEIYQSKVINCYRVSKLLQFVYGGELIFVSQPNNEYDHVYLRLENGKIDNNGLELKYIKE